MKRRALAAPAAARPAGNRAHGHSRDRTRGTPCCANARKCPARCPCCEADDHVVLEDRLAFADRARCDLVAGGHLAAHREAFALELRADREVTARDDDVVVLVQADGEARRGLFADFDQGRSPGEPMGDAVLRGGRYSTPASSATSRTPLRRRRPSASPVHFRSGDRSGGTARRPARS